MASRVARRIALLGVLVVAVLLGRHFLQRSAQTPGPEAPVPDAPQGPTAGLPWFRDVTAQAGITFVHFDSHTPQDAIEETMGSGLAWIDYDGDGWPDLFCVQGGPLPPGSHSGPLPTHKLYRNNRDGTFTDVTAAVGLDKVGHGMGCAVGDYDNDGFDDLVVTDLGGLTLFHNEPDPSAPGGRRFVDVTARSGLADPHWATSCAWVDIDGDGLLDLYVCNYVELIPGKIPVCESLGVRFSCSPTAFPHTTHKLFRNLGGGRFEDVSESSGVAAARPAPGLAVAVCDLDGDGKPDIYVANDMRPAYLFHNLGGGRFQEDAMFSGCALGPNGAPIAGMGVGVADVDGSGRPSLLVTNYQSDPNVLFLNRGGMRFYDATYPSGLGLPSQPRLKFGVAFLDADADGIPDVAVANGHVHPEAPRLHAVPFAQEAQLFLGVGPTKFRDVSAQAGPYFRRPLVGRGLAVADFDNDGRPDLAFSHNGGPVVLLHNETPTDNRAIGFELIGDGKQSNRNAVGARVEVEAGGRKRAHFVLGGGSYLS
ncbi:MAG: VCBS repeat-containing protein, partial [Zavarzinella sp.]|nr:VCBS repeat-containing protein [Zavarzinella sp.]